MNIIQKGLGILLIAFSPMLFFIGIQYAEEVGLSYLSLLDYLFIFFSPVGLATGIWALKEK